jgi:two-component system CheB/CheR fusion protein
MALGVMLSGMASDGTLGLEAGSPLPRMIHSVKYDSMPRSAVAAGCVDLILSPREIAQELARIAMHPYIAGKSPQCPLSVEDEAAAAMAHENDQSPLHSGGH